MTKIMSWGKSIVLVFIVFAGFIGTMVYQMSREQIDLVRDDYYQDEMAYQQHIERVANSQRAGATLSVHYQPDKQQIQLTVPAHLQTGTLLLYCPADRRQDVRQSLTSSTPAIYTVSMRNRPAGLWRAQLTWSDGQRGYYTERELTRP